MSLFNHIHRNEGAFRCKHRSRRKALLTSSRSTYKDYIHRPENLVTLSIFKHEEKQPACTRPQHRKVITPHTRPLMHGPNTENRRSDVLTATHTPLPRRHESFARNFHQLHFQRLTGAKCAPRYIPAVEILAYTYGHEQHRTCRALSQPSPTKSTQCLPPLAVFFKQVDDIHSQSAPA